MGLLTKESGAVSDGGNQKMATKWGKKLSDEATDLWNQYCVFLRV